MPDELRKLVEKAEGLLEEYRLFDNKDLLDQAMEIAEAIIEKYPEHDAGYHIKGDALIFKVQPERAIKVLKQAATINPKHPNVHYLIGFALSQLRKWSLAIPAFIVAKDLLGREHEELDRHIGWCMAQKGYDTGDDELIQQGIKLIMFSINSNQEVTNQRDGLQDLMIIYTSTKQFDKALTVAKRLKKLVPNDKRVDEKIAQIKWVKEQFARLTPPVN